MGRSLAEARASILGARTVCQAPGLALFKIDYLSATCYTYPSLTLRESTAGRLDVTCPESPSQKVGVAREIQPCPPTKSIHRLCSHPLLPPKPTGGGHGVNLTPSPEPAELDVGPEANPYSPLMQPLSAGGRGLLRACWNLQSLLPVPKSPRPPSLFLPPVN